MLKKFFHSPLLFLIFVLLANLFLVLLSYGATLQMYFWHDDYSILYYAQKYGPFSWPYFWIVESAKVLLKIFGLNPLPFFILELVLYLLTALAIGYFAFLLTKSKTTAVLASAFFAAGNLGSEGLFVVLGTGINSLSALLFIVFSFIFYFHFLSLGRKIFFILALACFFFTLEFVPVRSHLILPALVLVDYFFAPKDSKLLSYLRGAIKRMWPFVVIYLTQYLLMPTKWLFHYSHLENQTVLNQVTSFIKTFDLSFIPNYFGTFWNLFFPDELLFRFLHEYVRLHFPIEDFLGKNYLSFLQISLGTILFFLIVILIAFLKKKRANTKILVFSFLLLNLFLLSFYPLNPELILPTTHRYLLFSLFPLSVFLASLYNQIASGLNTLYSRTILLVIFLVPAFLNAIVSHNRTNTFVKEYSLVAKTFYPQLLEKISDFDDKLLLVVRSSDKNLRLRVGDAMRVGFLPSEAALAVHYQKDINKFKLVESVEDAADFLRKNDRFQLSHLRSFDFRNGKLVEDTVEVLSSFPSQ